MEKAKVKKRDFEVTEKMFVDVIDALFEKKEQKVLMSFFDISKKDGGNKCQLKK